MVKKSTVTPDEKQLDSPLTLPKTTRSLLIQAIAIQLVSAAIVWLCLPFALPDTVFTLPAILAGLTLLHALLAGLLSWLWASPQWWHLIHTLVPICLYAAYQAHLPGWLYLLLFLITLLLYWNTARNRVPLYLSNIATCDELAKLLPQGAHFADLGSGTGRVLKHLAKLRPDCQFSGFETAPLTYFYSRWSCRMYPNIVMHRESFERRTLHEFNVLYAFLSPQPMPSLWQKLQTEKKAAQLLISNSFIVPGVKPRKVCKIADRRQTTLYLYDVK
ncbi:methyltransferase type 12 [Parvibium lacunae]|uniref:Methyltransferase type 12 n=1 Tax=Parvibium lacunae TaxID=1888893 RepID=A0A368L6P3_9BURK|nr:methyltransferase type 12 [Parvibium lacunae]RCS59358.1 methyltransferase type 12 [Parvibium lacunae]